MHRDDLVAAASTQSSSGSLVLGIGIGLIIFGAIMLLGLVGRLKDSPESTRRVVRLIGGAAVVVGVVVAIVGGVLL